MAAKDWTSMDSSNDRQPSEEPYVTDSGYPTDDFGRPTGRDHHYRIPLNDTAALRIAVLADGHRWLKIDTDNSCDCDKRWSEACVQTSDSKGHIPGLAEYEVSKEWESPWGPGRLEDLEIRNANGGGTKVKGTVPAFDEQGQEFRLPVEFGVPETVSEVRDNPDLITDALQWAERDAWEELREAQLEAERECDHDHVLEGGVTCEAYCEDCGAEWIDTHDIPDRVTIVGTV